MYACMYSFDTGACMHACGWMAGWVCGRQVGRSVGRLLDGWLIGLLFLGSLVSLCGALFIICLRTSSANLSQPRSLPTRRCGCCLMLCLQIPLCLDIPAGCLPYCPVFHTSMRSSCSFPVLVMPAAASHALGFLIAPSTLLSPSWVAALVCPASNAEKQNDRLARPARDTFGGFACAEFVGASESEALGGRERERGTALDERIVPLSLPSYPIITSNVIMNYSQFLLHTCRTTGTAKMIDSMSTTSTVRNLVAEHVGTLSAQVRRKHERKRFFPVSAVQASACGWVGWIACPSGRRRFSRCALSLRLVDDRDGKTRNSMQTIEFRKV